MWFTQGKSRSRRGRWDQHAPFRRSERRRGKGKKKPPGRSRGSDGRSSERGIGTEHGARASTRVHKYFATGAASAGGASALSATSWPSSSTASSSSPPSQALRPELPPPASAPGRCRRARHRAAERHRAGRQPAARTRGGRRGDGSADVAHTIIWMLCHLPLTVGGFVYGSGWASPLEMGDSSRVVAAKRDSRVAAAAATT